MNPLTQAESPVAAGAPTDPTEIAGAVAALSKALTDVDGAHRRIRQRLAAQLGLSTGELTAIFIVGGMEACTPKHLAAELGLSTGAITALVDRLDKAGDVTRVAHPSDRRSQLLVLTESGEDVLQQIKGCYDAAIEVVIRSSPCVFEGGVVDCLHHAALAIDAAVVGAPQTP